jgi:metal-dependent HD superfamily phosphatase/phosphodiesterase
VSQVARKREIAPHASNQDLAPETSGAADFPLITLAEIQQDRLLSTFITSADRVMEGLGFTEHGFRHANLTARIAFNVLSRLGMDGRMADLASIAAYLHDVGNMVARENHGPTGALLVYDVLKDRMAMNDLSLVMAAVGNHEEEGGEGISPISAAVILADKSDVHRSRVRKSAQIDFDIHDRVNYAAEQSFLRVDSTAQTITLQLTIDTEISDVMEYFEIFLHRMMMCRRAAERLDCRFKLSINGADIL